MPMRRPRIPPAYTCANVQHAVNRFWSGSMNGRDDILTKCTDPHRTSCALGVVNLQVPALDLSQKQVDEFPIQLQIDRTIIRFQQSLVA